MHIGRVTKLLSAHKTTGNFWAGGEGAPGNAVGTRLTGRGGTGRFTTAGGGATTTASGMGALDVSGAAFEGATATCASFVCAGNGSESGFKKSPVAASRIAPTPISQTVIFLPDVLERFAGATAVCTRVFCSPVVLNTLGNDSGN